MKFSGWWKKKINDVLLNAKNRIVEKTDKILLDKTNEINQYFFNKLDYFNNLWNKYDKNIYIKV